MQRVNRLDRAIIDLASAVPETNSVGDARVSACLADHAMLRASQIPDPSYSLEKTV